MNHPFLMMWIFGWLAGIVAHQSRMAIAFRLAGIEPTPEKRAVYSLLGIVATLVAWPVFVPCMIHESVRGR